MERCDVAIVGAGIVGLAHASLLSNLGLKVVVFERNPRPLGASVRNFGLIATAVLPPGPFRDLGLRSRRAWLQLIQRQSAWCGRRGSVFLAQNEEEMQCLREFTDLYARHGWNGRMLNAEEAKALSPNAKTESLKGGACGTENIVVDPLEVIMGLIDELKEKGVQFHFNTTVVGVDDGYVGADHVMVKAKTVLLCTGDDFQTLFPVEFATYNLTLVRLQMLKLCSREPGFDLGPAISGALTAYRHRSFHELPSFPAFEQMVLAKFPEELEHCVHALVSQDKNGELVVGDSMEETAHDYVFTRDHLDKLILRYLGTLIDASSLEIKERWVGSYPKATKDIVSFKELRPDIHAIQITGGLGLTLSFGVAQQFVETHWGPMQISES